MTTAPTLPPRTLVGFVSGLAGFGDRPALIADGATVTYADLAARADTWRRRLGEVRRLVLLTGANRVDTLAAYLGALAGGHVVLLVPGDNPRHLTGVVETYDPDVVLDLARGVVDVRRPGSAHVLHPDLALLLSTSGSTGSPKLVRLSWTNLQSNAEAIADYLAIDEQDRAVTTLPMHYCYGLSVLHSHLLVGASVVLTDLSVVDACFWDLVRSTEATSFAGVPYTFDLLDRVGFDRMRLPHLRYVTQAGGRMAPEQVRRYAELGRRQGWHLVVMYGQTEATARMGYLPPERALDRPEAIGRAVPGGSFRLDPVDGLGEPADGVPVGELVYSGPNVMLGYATSPADLASGRSIDELRTGDLARIAPDGLVEIVGRRSRIAKVVGLRIDLDQVERLLARDGFTTACAEHDDRLVVAAETLQPRPVVDAVRAATGLPSWAIAVVGVPDLPRTPNGKPCYSAVAAMARQSDPRPGAAPEPAPARLESDQVGTEDVRSLYAELLGRDDVTDDSSFVSLDGDSLSYVEVSIRLEQLLGELPSGWHTATVAELGSSARRAGDGGGARWRRWGRRIETNVVLRAVAIVLIVGSHANLFALAGGAHVLLGVAGFNLGRFHLTDGSRAERRRHLVTSALRVAVPSVAWVGGLALLAGSYPWPTALLLNGALGPDGWTEPAWYFWFIEAVVWSILALAGLLSLPWLDRWERRHPFALAMAFVGVALLWRFEVFGLGGQGDRIHDALVVFWLFALGWAAAKASAARQRLLVSAVAVLSTYGFFGDGQREVLVAAGVLLLVWVPHLRVPSVTMPVVGVLAASSLYIYLTHWQVYPHLEDRVPLLALAASLLVGIAFAKVAGAGMARLERLARLRGHDDDDPGGDRTALRPRRRGRDRHAVPTGAS